MADEVPLPDPQLEAILEMLRQLLTVAGGGTASSSTPGSDPTQPIGIDYTQQLDQIWSLLDDIHALNVDMLDAMVKGGGGAGGGGGPQLDAILEELKKLYDVSTAVTATEITAPTEEKGGGLGELLGMLNEFKFAILAAVGVVLGAVAAVSQFVQALDPGLMEQFGRTIRDLQATIGVAFVGIFEQGMNVFRELAAAVQPVFQALKPVIDSLVGTVLRAFQTSLATITPILLAVVPVLKLVAELFAIIVNVLRPIIAIYQLFGQILFSIIGAFFTLLSSALQPLVSVLEAFMDGFQEIINLFSVILRVIFDMLNAFVTSLFAGGLDEVVKQVTDAFRELVKMILIAAVKLAQFAGNNDFAKRLRDAFNQQGQAATGSTSIKGLEQIGKDMATASVNAAGTTSAKDATNADIVKTLDVLIANQDKNGDKIANAILKNVPGSQTVSEAAKVVLPPVGYASGAATRLLARLNPFGD